MGRAERDVGLRRASIAANAALPIAIGIAIAAGCASEESVAFTDKDCAGYGCNAGASSSSSSSSGSTCTPDDSCTVSFADDVYAKIIAGPPGCAGGSGCHETASPQDLKLVTGDAHAAYTALLAYHLDGTPGPAGAYVVPCDADASKLLCNVTIAGATNPFGKCGTLMPLTLDGQMKLTQAEVDQIAEWIACGAPEN